MKLNWLKHLPPGLRSRVLRLGFNLHPAFRSTGGRVIAIAPDLSHIRVKLPFTRRTRNIVGSMYGGSLFSVTDGAHPIMLMSALGSGVVVWDKSASIRFRKPAYTALYIDFHIDADEIALIRHALAKDHEVTRSYTIELKDSAAVVYAVVERTVYIAEKGFYRSKTTGVEPCNALSQAHLPP